MPGEDRPDPWYDLSGKDSALMCMLGVLIVARGTTLAECSSDRGALLYDFISAQKGLSLVADPAAALR